MSKTSPQMRERMEHWEGLVLHSYPDPLTHGKPYTIGYGHTGDDVFYPGQTCTQAQADAWFESDLSTAELFVEKMVGKHPTNPEQADAMNSFTYNAGVGNFQRSTILKMHNKGRFLEAGNAFLLWNPGNPVLQARRRTERAIYLKELVRIFQRAHGFADGDVDGIVGPQTRAAGWKDTP